MPGIVALRTHGGKKATRARSKEQVSGTLAFDEANMFWNQRRIRRWGAPRGRAAAPPGTGMAVLATGGVAPHAKAGSVAGRGRRKKAERGARGVH